MKRREFISVLGGTLSTWPLAVRSQPLPMGTGGFLGPTTASVATKRISAFVARLGNLGWTEDKNLRINYRWADGHSEKFKPLAQELVRLNVHVIVTWGTETAIAVKQATSVIPIVFTIVADPIGSGLVGSLARPGGNATGLSTQQTDGVGKRIELLREIIPSLRRLEIIVNTTNLGSVLELRVVQQVAAAMGIEVDASEIRDGHELEAHLEKIGNQAQALFISSDALLNGNREHINAFALRRRLPTVYGFRDG